MPSRISVVVAYKNITRDTEKQISTSWYNKVDKEGTHALRMGLDLYNHTF